MDKIPNPGSPEAVEAGCACPRMDNHHGKGRPTLEGFIFFVSELCPLHCKDPRHE